MKKNLFLATALVVAFASCKKSNSTPDSPHITFTVDGTSKTFNTGLTANKYVGSQESIIIAGLTSLTGGEAFTLILGASGSNSITVKTYVYTDAGFSFDATYASGVGGSTNYEAGSTFSQSASHIGQTVTNNMVLHITAIDAVSIKGTFSGDFYLDGDATQSKKSITNGDFYAKFQ